MLYILFNSKIGAKIYQYFDITLIFLIYFLFFFTFEVEI